MSWRSIIGSVLPSLTLSPFELSIAVNPRNTKCSPPWHTVLIPCATRKLGSGSLI